MSGEQTFGAWLLEQRERDDTTGTLARAWGQLRDARGYNRHTRAKSIRELMSSSLGEDWTGLHGDEAIDAAEAEWRQGTTLQPDPQPVRSYLGTEAQQMPIPDAPAPMAVLTIDGRRYELTPGRHYVLTLSPVLREAPDEGEQPGGGITLTGEPTLTVWTRPDGGYDWGALYGVAERNLPDDFDLSSIGWAGETG
jgi:hypothetical protein